MAKMAPPALAPAGWVQSLCLERGREVLLVSSPEEDGALLLPGKTFELCVSVTTGDVLRCHIDVEDGLDVGIEVRLQQADGTSSALHAMARADECVETWTVDACGTCSLTVDNAFAWFRSKTVHVMLEITPASRGSSRLAGNPAAVSASGAVHVEEEAELRRAYLSTLRSEEAQLERRTVRLRRQLAVAEGELQRVRQVREAEEAAAHRAPRGAPATTPPAPPALTPAAEQVVGMVDDAPRVAGEADASAGVPCAESGGERRHGRGRGRAGEGSHALLWALWRKLALIDAQVALSARWVHHDENVAQHGAQLKNVAQHGAQLKNGAQHDAQYTEHDGHRADAEEARASPPSPHPIPNPNPNAEDAGALPLRPKGHSAAGGEDGGGAITDGSADGARTVDGWGGDGANRHPHPHPRPRPHPGKDTSEGDGTDADATDAAAPDASPAGATCLLITQVTLHGRLLDDFGVLLTARTDVERVVQRCLERAALSDPLEGAARSKAASSAPTSGHQRLNASQPLGLASGLGLGPSNHRQHASQAEQPPPPPPLPPPNAPPSQASDVLPSSHVTSKARAAAASAATGTASAATACTAGASASGASTAGASGASGETPIGAPRRQPGGEDGVSDEGGADGEDGSTALERLQYLSRLLLEADPQATMDVSARDDGEYDLHSVLLRGRRLESGFGTITAQTNVRRLFEVCDQATRSGHSQ